jgi:poly(A) polymerase
LQVSVDLSQGLSVLAVAKEIGDNRGAWPSSEVGAQCKAMVPELLAAEREAVAEGLTDCLLTRDVDAALEWLLHIGYLRELMPELTKTKDLQQEAGRRHKDVWEHTKLVVRQAVRRPSVRWAALLHDIGKVPTRTFTDKGVHFHGHAEVGARMFDRMCKRIHFERPMRRKVRFLIKHHLRAAQYSPDWTDSAVRRFDRDMGEHLGDLLDLSRADITSKRPGRRKALLRQISSIQERIDALREIDSEQPPLLPGIGNAIMEHFALKPSRFIGDLKKAIEKAVESGELEPRREDAYYIEWMERTDLLGRLSPREPEKTSD